MTEEEAKMKWCPFVRVGLLSKKREGKYAPAAASYNRMEFEEFISGKQLTITSDGSESETRCIGSACMAWRATDNEGAPCKPGDPEPPPMSAGYCGLAGKP